jgi:hypothetical protein
MMTKDKRSPEELIQELLKKQRRIKVQLKDPTLSDEQKAELQSRLTRAKQSAYRVQARLDGNNHM